MNAVVRALASFILITLLLRLLVTIGGQSALLQENLYAIAALLFIAAPFAITVLPRTPHGAVLRQQLHAQLQPGILGWRELRVALITAALTFPLYVVGFHLHQVLILGTEFSPGSGAGISTLLVMSVYQLVGIALPEEFFFRGYMQPALRRLFRSNSNLLGVSFPAVAITTTSLLFALGHYLVEPLPARLAVFFPSLLFGFLRHRTGTIGAAVIYHALCNLLVFILLGFYQPMGG